jgi:hypothetical protein
MSACRTGACKRGTCTRSLVTAPRAAPAPPPPPLKSCTSEAAPLGRAAEPTEGGGASNERARASHAVWCLGGRWGVWGVGPSQMAGGNVHFLLQHGLTEWKGIRLPLQEAARQLSKHLWNWMMCQVLRMPRTCADEERSRWRNRDSRVLRSLFRAVCSRACSSVLASAVGPGPPPRTVAGCVLRLQAARCRMGAGHGRSAISTVHSPQGMAPKPHRTVCVLPVPGGPCGVHTAPGTHRTAHGIDLHPLAGSKPATARKSPKQHCGSHLHQPVPLHFPPAKDEQHVTKHATARPPAPG